ncbi:MAG: cobyrinate a,c-diamide synthase [Desulfobacterales bacterium]|nr:cobyrinate a,c-diamide synthase [Desulfobacterales bacterium]
MNPPSVIISALRGGSGKTIISLGIIAAWKKSGKKIAPFKKGPDYIDSGWLTLAAGQPCYNLDSYLIQEDLLKISYNLHSKNSDISVIEGNRGLFDGIESEGKTSTAELSKLLGIPIILCVDCTKITRTMAALISGCINFDPNVNIQGVILNRVAGKRHEAILKTCIEKHCKISVIGAIPKSKIDIFPERHMGLVPIHEHNLAQNSIDLISNLIESNLDLDLLLKIAKESIQKNDKGIFSQSYIFDPEKAESKKSLKRPVIGVIQDSAFQFYYPENLESLSFFGSDLVFISPLSNASIPEIHGLYIGGGFPETHAEELSKNESFKRQLKILVENGLPVYAECGGLIYLAEQMIYNKKNYDMCGVLPLTLSFSEKPHGHGYILATVDTENPYYKMGTEIKGHEFHYSKVSKWGGTSKDLVFNMKRGTGFIDGKDGILYKNVLASYTHVHALGTIEWAKNLVSNAKEYMNSIKGLRIEIS